jgi:hypothetical protein
MSQGSLKVAVVAGCAAALALTAGASAGNEYPPPVSPIARQPAPDGPFRTIRVCAPSGRRTRGCASTIQAAVNRARPGDTVRIPNGTYREAVAVAGRRKRYIKLVGNRADPGKVVIDGRRGNGRRRANGVRINGANSVTVDGIRAQYFNANGFLVVNVTGYRLTNLKAMQTGAYGIYAFNSRGGEVSDSVAAWNNDAGFYIGQTPPQARPIRSIVRNVKAYGNVIGFSGTNMRYVTITRSEWFNNGLGIVPNALDSAKYTPEEDNVITDNDIFWNNFNYFEGAPFKLRAGATKDIPQPVGTGVLLFGGRTNRIEGNRVFGNFLIGVGALKQILLDENEEDADLEGNIIRNNAFGSDGNDLNGRELLYDGSGKDNCVSGNTGVKLTVPADGSTFAPCGASGFTGTNTPSESALADAISFTADPDHERFWIRSPHAPRNGYTPLERFKRGETEMELPGS